MNQATFEVRELLEQQQQSRELYLEFLRNSDLNCGLYVLPAASTDPQQPHDEDEVYYVIQGSGSFTADGVESNVNPGTILFVKKGIEHRFHSIQEDLVILVFFASATSENG